MYTNYIADVHIHTWLDPAQKGKGNMVCVDNCIECLVILLPYAYMDLLHVIIYRIGKST